MKKMPSLYPRNFKNKGYGYDASQVNTGVSWVFEGEAIATQKFDGTSCYVQNGILYKRYDHKKGAQKSLPTGSIACQPEADHKTGHWPHWIPVIKGAPEDWIHNEAWEAVNGKLEDGTYELCGPRINGNPENLGTHQFLKHGSVVYDNFRFKLESIRKFLKENDIEGVVFHHPDGRMCKVTKEGFGMQR
jgi:hypothetical protein